MKSSVTQKVRKADELGQFEESRGKFLFLHKMGDKDFPYRDDRKPKFNDCKDQIIFFIHSFLYMGSQRIRQDLATEQQENSHP